MSKAKETLYKKWQLDANSEHLTWRQFYERLYGQCLWMESTQYSGEWLDKIMGE